MREVRAAEEWGEVPLPSAGLLRPGSCHRHGAPPEKQEPSGAKPRVRHSEPCGHRILLGDGPPAGAHV